MFDNDELISENDDNQVEFVFVVVNDRSLMSLAAADGDKIRFCRHHCSLSVSVSLTGKFLLFFEVMAFGTD